MGWILNVAARGWDVGGVGLVPWSAGDHPDPPLRLGHGLQQGNHQMMKEGIVHGWVCICKWQCCFPNVSLNLTRLLSCIERWKNLVTTRLVLAFGRRTLVHVQMCRRIILIFSPLWQSAAAYLYTDSEIQPRCWDCCCSYHCSGWNVWPSLEHALNSDSHPWNIWKPCEFSFHL